MVKANELRIGNYVWLVYSPYVSEQSREYCKIGIEELKRASGMLSVNSFYHEPIVLNPDILEKAGFVERSKSKHTHIFELDNSPDIEYLFAITAHFTSGFFFKGKRVGKVTFLHKLQNMVYTLTDEELEINL